MTFRRKIARAIAWEIALAFAAAFVVALAEINLGWLGAIPIVGVYLVYCGGQHRESIIGCIRVVRYGNKPAHVHCPDCNIPEDVPARNVKVFRCLNDGSKTYYNFCCRWCERRVDAYDSRQALRNLAAGAEEIKWLYGKDAGVSYAPLDLEEALAWLKSKEFDQDRDALTDGRSAAG